MEIADRFLVGHWSSGPGNEPDLHYRGQRPTDDQLVGSRSLFALHPSTTRLMTTMTDTTAKMRRGHIYTKTKINYPVEYVAVKNKKVYVCVREVAIRMLYFRMEFVSIV